MFLRATAGLLTLALAFAAAAVSAPIKARIALKPGTLQLKVESVKAGKGTLLIKMQVRDGRGNGRGWKLQASKPVVVRSIAQRCASASTCTPARLARPPQGTLVVDAARGSGMGVIKLYVRLAAATVPQLSIS